MKKQAYAANAHAAGCGCGHDHGAHVHSAGCGCAQQSTAQGAPHSHDGDGHSHARELHAGEDDDPSHSSCSLNGGADACGCGNDHDSFEVDIGCDCGHDHSHDGGDSGKRTLVLGGIGLLAFVAALLWPEGTVKLLLFVAAYLLIGHQPVITALKNITRGEIFDENFLMTVATIGAFAIGEYPEAVAVMIFYQVGEYFQDRAVGQSQKSISALMKLKPDVATLTDGRVVDAALVSVGDVIRVVPGERIPLDGVVVTGSSHVDNAAITGESVPVDVLEGSQVYSGGVNQSGVLEIRATKPLSESTVSKILEMVQNASKNKAPTENFIRRFAKVYTPIVCGLAVLVGVIPPLFFGGVWSEWVYNALVFLVVSCPCALVISVPLSFFGGIGGASKQGVLFKGGNYLEALGMADVYAFDKTGTLTTGSMEVSRVAPVGMSEAELLRYAAHAEAHATHPIAAAITAAYGRSVDIGAVSGYENRAGQGISAAIDGAQVLCGNEKLLREAGVAGTFNEAGTAVYLAVNGAFAGSIALQDAVKPGAKEALEGLRALGAKKLVMLSGDTERSARAVADALGIDEVHASLMPQQKVERLQQLKGAAQGKVAFVGDGINDAPVLAQADVGVAMGGIGSDAAIEAADVVIMNDDITKLVGAVKQARRTRRVVKQNITMSLVVKVGVLVLSALGLASMWWAVIADVGVALVATLNASRMLRMKG